MHRVRQSLPFFEEFGWEVEVIAVDAAYIESYSYDPLLIQTIPKNVVIHYVKALSYQKTRKFGLGSLSIRSFLHYRSKGNELLRSKKFDLIYFSTTAFHVMALGPYWKRKFKVPFILDIQDPWRNDFYLNKPTSERPPKFWLAYTIDKYLEAYTVPKSDGIISVSQGYCDQFMQRYPLMKKNKFRVIPFGASLNDFSIGAENIVKVEGVSFDSNKINFLYIGRGGHDLRFALEIIFKAFKQGLKQEPELFSQIYFWFIGTSYAKKGMGKQTVKPIADLLGIGDYVIEIPDRVQYFETLFLLKKADVLVVPGSTDTSYTASKIYPYVLAEKPLLAVFYKESSVISFLRDINYGKIVAFDHLVSSTDFYVEECYRCFKQLLEKEGEAIIDYVAFEPYTAKARTFQQVKFFDHILSKHKEIMDNIERY